MEKMGPESREPKRRIRSPKSPLMRLLEDPKLCLLFREFLYSRSSNENLSFWIEVEHFKQIATHKQEDLRTRALELWNKYFIPRSNYEINVDGDDKMELHERLKSGICSPEMFTKIQESIFTIMETDCYPKFIGSDAYCKYIDQEGKAQELSEKKNSLSTVKKDDKDKKEKKKSPRFVLLHLLRSTKSNPTALPAPPQTQESFFSQRSNSIILLEKWQRTRAPSLDAPQPHIPSLEALDLSPSRSSPQKTLSSPRGPLFTLEVPNKGVIVRPQSPRSPSCPSPSNSSDNNPRTPPHTRAQLTRSKAESPRAAQAISSPRSLTSSSPSVSSATCGPESPRLVLRLPDGISRPRAEALSAKEKRLDGIKEEKVEVHSETKRNTIRNKVRHVSSSLNGTYRIIRITRHEQLSRTVNATSATFIGDPGNNRAFPHVF